MPEPARRPGPDSTLEEVRALLVQTAVEDLRRTGVEIGLSHLKLSSVIAAAGVSRSTAYRSLADELLPPQSVLHREVLATLLRRDTREANRTVVTSAITAELARQAANLASPDIAHRTYALRAIIRVGAGTSYESVAASIDRSILTAAYGALRSSAADDWRVAELVRGEAGVSEVFGDIYSDLSARFGYRLRPEYTILQFATAVAALVEGMAMRHGLSDHLVDVMRPTGPDGEPEEWTLYAAAFEGVFMVFFEPDDANPFADLGRY